MAIVSFGPIVDDARGSIGGVTFSKTHAGTAARAKPRPPRPRRGDQLFSQVSMGQAINGWTALDLSDREDWDAYAATVDLFDSLGNLYHPTGINCFVWRYTAFRAAGVTTIPTAAPSQPGLPSSPVVTMDFSGDNLRIADIDPTPGASENFLFTALRPSPRNVHPRTWVSVTKGFNIVLILPFIMTVDYKASWPSGVEGRAWLLWRYMDEFGRISIRQRTFLDFTG